MVSSVNGDSAVGKALAGVSAAGGYEKSFADFTVTLVREVMDALISSSISQMKAYADLVSELESGLAAFKSAKAGPDSVTAWLNQNAPETGLATPGPLSQSSADAINSLYATALRAAVPLSTLTQPTSPISQYTLPGISDMSSLAAKTLTSNQIGTSTDSVQTAQKLSISNGSATLCAAVVTVLDYNAGLSYTELNTLLQMGLMRIIVPDGHVLTRMTFSLDTKESFEQSSTDLSSSALSVRAGLSYGGKLLKASASFSYNKIHVKVASEKTTTSTEILTTVMGEVLVNFRSDFYPALPSQAKA